MKKRNVTISLDEDLARWARVRAAECDKSVSQFVAEMIEAHMARTPSEERERVRRGLDRFLAVKPRQLSDPGEHYPTREEIYDRHRVR